MSVFHAVRLIAITLMFPQGASASWNGTSWGMQPVEVEHATGAKAKKIRVTAQDRSGLGKVGNTGSYNDGSAKYAARYYYDDLGLKGIELSSKAIKCTEVLSNLKKRYGRPLRHSNQVIMHLFIWHDVAEGNRVRFFITGNKGDCRTHIERLSDFEENDRNAAR